MNFDDFDRPLDPDAEALAYKLQAYLKSKSGNLLEPVTLTHKKNKYYWCILAKSFILVNGDSEMYLLPWKKTEKNESFRNATHLLFMPHGIHGQAGMHR